VVRNMKRKVYIFLAIVVALCALCIIKAPYLVWSIGGFGDEEAGFLACILLVPSLLIMIYLCIGMLCQLRSTLRITSTIEDGFAVKFNSWIEKIEKKGRAYFKKNETKLNMPLKQIFVRGMVYCIAVFVLFFYLVNKFYGYSAYGDCLFTPTPTYDDNKDISCLYTRGGRTVVNNKRHYLDFTKHEDCDISRDLLSIDGYREKSCVIECPGGPYFCYLKKVDIDQVGKGRAYDYNRYDDKVYYQYENYEIDYLISIYNSEGRYVGDFEATDRFKYYPDKKKIDGEEYSYRVHGEDLKYSCYDELAEIVHEDLVDYVSSMNDEVQPSSKVPEVQPQSTPQPRPQSTPQPTPAPVPMQVFKKCWSCLGGGQCSTCYGSGSIYYPYPTGEQRCPVCGGTGRCNICAGRGGEYVVEYH